MTRIHLYTLIISFTCCALLLMPASGSCWFGSKKKVKSDTIPQFELDIPDKSGVMSTSDLEGKVVLVNFWATWCGPCVEEFPDLGRLHADLSSQGFMVFGISADKRTADVVNFLKKQDPGFPIAMGTNKVSREFGAGAGLPVSFLINRQGKITKKYYGPRPYETFKADIEKLL